MNIPNFDQEMTDYFNTLPKFVQESILQSGVPLYSKKDLEACACHLMNQDCCDGQ